MSVNDPAALEPLVAPGAELSQEQAVRAHRQMLLPGFGQTAQRRLRAARVLVIGAGALGCASVPYLTGAGVGTIGIVDDDLVELTNLHRQVAHGTADLGRSKAESLADTAAGIDPGLTIETHQIRLTSGNALALFQEYDLIIDGSDNFATRYLANDAAQLLGKPLVWGAILQYYGQVGVAWHAHGPGYRDLFPAPPPPQDVVSCGTGGVWPGLCGTIGSLLATEAAKVITGVGRPLVGRVLLYDALAGTSRELAYQKDPQGQPITELIDYEQFCNDGQLVPQAVDPAELVELLRAGASLQLLDVRTDAERARLAIRGSQWLPLPKLEESLSRSNLHGRVGDTTDRPLVVYCEHGPRSAHAATLLLEQGATFVRYLRDGIRGFAALAPQMLEGNETR